MDRFRPMRRFRQALSDDDIEKILTKHTYGVLSVIGDSGYPYTVPLNYVYEDGHFYFHCAKSGHKLDAIRNNGRCSFCVVDSSDIYPHEMTTLYRSVIAFGRAQIIEDEAELIAVSDRFVDRFNPEMSADLKEKYFQKEMPLLAALKMRVEHITGKEAIELKQI